MKQSPSFIGQYDLLDRERCDAIIDEFRACEEREIYRPYRPTDAPQQAKECWQISYLLSRCPDSHRPIFSALQLALDKYLEEYIYASFVRRFEIFHGYNLQHYEPGWAYHPFHAERDGAHVSLRHLVWMVYLNDVTDQGGTEFYYQNLVTEPRAGRILIWPSDWTHTHRGIPSPTQDKYILTGWLCFLPA